MHLKYSPEQEKLQQELRAYFADLMTPEERRHLRHGYSAVAATEAYRSVVRRLGEDGWLGIGWPREIGGQGRTMVEQAIFNDEAAYANVPTPLLTINSIGPAIAAHGTEEQKRTLVQGILKGRVHFAIGYSEPDSGTDLASLRTRAVREGDEYVINGQKLWTGMMEAADYIWLAVRTDPDAFRHKGISVLVVPRDAPGVESTRLRTLGDNSIAAVSFTDVRVPVENCIGGENNGWAIITGQLNSERVALVSSVQLERGLAAVTAWAKEQHYPDGTRLIDKAWVRTALARVKADAEFLRVLNRKLATAVDNGSLNAADASSAKVFGSELMGRGARMLAQIAGPDAVFTDDDPAAILGGSMAKGVASSNVMTFIGGVNEIQRDLIAQFGLGLPRAKR
ncbi:acyl-CoA dehydrogenase family protein [Cryptosporangium minutisporangium]|uniref:Acyl-CoA dehydrogenase family protein n=1 Tax=Cryptosporangium minutisporangium TaxID=113569 RepID=A0ABP6SR45_9ACTN